MQLKPTAKHPKPASRGRASVAVDPGGLLRISFAGRITGPIVERLLEDLKGHIAELRQAQQQVHILIDISGIASHDSSSRTAVKEATSLDFDRGAAFGGNVAQGLIMQYLQRSIDPVRTRYYRNRRDALTWLNGGTPRASSQPRRLLLSLAVWGVLTVVAAVAATVYSWSESQANVKSDSRIALSQSADTVQADLEKRFQVYIDALYSFRGLYRSSDDVNRGEFHTYFSSLNIAQDYPGFNAISFVKELKAGQLPAYINGVRRDTTLKPGGYPDFKIFPAATKPEYSVLTYNEPNGEGSIGFDLSSNPERQRVLQSARDSGRPMATATVDLVGATAARGFLITLPIYGQTVPQATADRRQALTGYVNAVFDYQKFFGEVFAQEKLDGLNLAIRDSAGQSIYTTNRAGSGPLPQITTRTIEVAGQKFNVTLAAGPSYGLSQNANKLSNTIIWAGLAITILLIIIFAAFIRSRRQAIALADTMTEDLANEKASVERKVIERTRQLHEANAQLQASIKGLPFGFAVIDLKDRILFANDELSRLVGQTIPADPAKTRPILTAIKQRYLGIIDLAALINEAQATHKPVERGVLSGSQYLRFFCMPITLPETGHVIGTAMIMEDVTEEKATQRSREEFFSIASHELRTPLTAIMGNASLMLDIYGQQFKDPELHEMVVDVKQASKRLIAIVNDFLDMSRLEQGKMTFRNEPIDLEDIIGQVVRECAAIAAEQAVELVHAAPATNRFALADSNKVHQILINLVGNALKFTQAGAITIDVSVTGKTIKISVVDTGQGISVKSQHLLFHKFQQAADSILTRDNTRGTGLGLYISGLMAKGMNGKLYLSTSAPGKGSCFVLELPLDQSKAKPDPA